MPSAVRFQVSLPTPWAIVGVGRCSRADFPHVFPAYERAMLDELARICDAIPHEHLSVQWDIAHELIIFDGRWQAPYEMWRPFPGMGGYFADNVARLIAAMPADVETGIHLCYGDRDGRHFIEPLDLGKVIEFATQVVERVERTLNWRCARPPAKCRQAVPRNARGRRRIVIISFTGDLVCNAAPIAF